jgi:hypothetical protein
MGSTISLIHLPAQSGKTRKMTELINKWKNLIDLNGDFTGTSSENINIIFTSNTKLLTKQTANRIHQDVDSIGDLSDLSEEDDDESISISMDVKERESKTIAWIHNTKKTLSVNDVFAKVTSDDDDDEINNIICCTNKSRMKLVLELLVKLNKKFIRRNFNKNVNIWIDEADACIKVWNNYIQQCEELIDSKFIQNIVLVTATMVPVYKHLHSINIDPYLRMYENTHAPVYHKYCESEIYHEFSAMAQNSENHLRNILLKKPEIINAGTRLFCPGNKTKKSHEINCEILIEAGFNVLILNGTSKEFRLFDGTVIDISEYLETDLEVSKTLNKLYYEYGLFNQPFAVTGNLCIGRGITFASKIDDNEFVFTHGIIPDVSNGDEGYQMVARCCGNIKNFAKYHKPLIYVSEKTDLLIRQQENLAVEFAKKFFQGEEDSMIKVTRDMLKEAIGDDATEGGEGGEGVSETGNLYKRVPVIVDGLSDDDITFITNAKRKEKIVFILDKIKTNNILYNFIKNKNVCCAQITQPKTNNSYKKHITPVVNASISNIQYSIDLTQKYKDKNNWQCFIDNKENRLCFVVWSLDEVLYPSV